MDRTSLEQVLGSRCILTFGLFIDTELVAYAILKAVATKKAYSGRLVKPSMAGRSVGKLLIRYRYWIEYHLDVRLRTTMHQDNLASSRGHASIRPCSVLAQLPSGYQLLEYTVTKADADPPKLLLPAPPPGS
jgi:hypothetical protein